MQKYLFIVIGGGAGALLRYLSINVVDKLFAVPFPTGTLFVNAVGSLIIGFLYKIFEAYTVGIEFRLLLTTGFLGGYTTFSTYSLESARYLLDGNYRLAFLNIASNNVLCLVFTIMGIMLGRAFTGKLAP
jgi:CrcB protein